MTTHRLAFYVFSCCNITYCFLQNNLFVYSSHLSTFTFTQLFRCAHLLCQFFVNVIAKVIGAQASLLQLILSGIDRISMCSCVCCSRLNGDAIQWQQNIRIYLTRTHKGIPILFLNILFAAGPDGLREWVSTHIFANLLNLCAIFEWVWDFVRSWGYF